MTALGTFLQGHLATGRLAGVHDCCTFPAEWTMLHGWSDPMEEWRGLYDTEGEAISLMLQAGGLDRLYTRGMAAAVHAETGRIGLPVIEEGQPLQPGDIGVMALEGTADAGIAQAGTIYTGKRWALVADRGLAFASFDLTSILAAWRP